jgi:hypothetical protein
MELLLHDMKLFGLRYQLFAERRPFHAQVEEAELF